jgi:enoyl-[acyl-carrier protein] reductase II
LAHIATGSLAGAVSEAGGLGVIASASRDASYLREQITAARSITRKPFGVNIMLMNPHTPQLIDIVCEEKIPVVATGAGSPEPYMQKLLEAGCRVIPVIPHVRAAQKMEALGAFAVVAEGRESGGHVGPVATMALVPQVVDAVRIPVVAAGGIADGRGLVAAMALGAVGVQMGTVFLLAKECPISQAYKDAVKSCGDNDTVITGIGTRDEVRCIKNELTKRYFELVKQPDKEKEWLELLTGSLNRAVQGDMASGSIQVGQIAGMLREEKTARQIMEDIMLQAERVCRKLEV